MLMWSFWRGCILALKNVWVFRNGKTCRGAMLGLDLACGSLHQQHLVYDIGSHTGCSEKHLVLNAMQKIRDWYFLGPHWELVGKMQHVLLSTWVNSAAGTLQYCLCLQRCRLLRLTETRSLQLQQPTGAWGTLLLLPLNGRKELAASDTALLQKSSFGATEHFEGKNSHCRVCDSVFKVVPHWEEVRCRG